MVHFTPNLKSLRKELHTIIRAHSQAVILCDSNTLSHCWPQIGNDPEFSQLNILEVEPGEDTKSIEIVANLWQSLIDMKLDRKGVLINIGGGVVTDLGGFISSTYKRGISCVHIPTSLLGMVDASIGGKTGINLGHNKNQVGTFIPNITTLICPSFIDTLDKRELISGFAEMIKHAWISGEHELNAMECCSPTDLVAVKVLIEQSAAIKMNIVERDFKESSLRKQLNFGHTVGHALESCRLNTEHALTHGQAVAFGMLLETKISLLAGICQAATYQRMEVLISGIYGVFELYENVEDLWKFMLNDKKNDGTLVRMIAIEAVGACREDFELSYDLFTRAIIG